MVAELGLDTVTVHRGRAEELVGTVSAPFVTARAVARLDKLARWCVPLLEPAGTLVAMKGRSAAEELAADRPALVRLGMVDAVVSEHGGDLLEEPVLTVDLRFEPKHRGSKAKRGGKAKPGSKGTKASRGPKSGRTGGAVGARRPDATT